MDQNETSDKKILIIEDDQFMGSLLERKFEQNNLKISRAINVEDARKILENEPVSLILLDIILPGMDGLTYLKELKENPKTKDVPVIITSNLGSPEEIERGMAGGAIDYIVKAHATPIEIVEKVKTTLGK